MIVILDNLRSALNVGSIIRTCDAFGIKEVYFSGITPGPDNPKVKKTSLGAEKNIKARVVPSTRKLIVLLKKNGMNIYSLEISKEALDIRGFMPVEPFVLIVGNEVSGVSEDLLALSNKVLKIGMQGTKESLNVSVAFGIAAYTLKR